jgi:ribosomal subunit interface protein
MPLDLVLKGRGVRITDQMRRRAQGKLAKIQRIDPRVTWVEVEVILEHNPRIDGNHRIEVACSSGRRVVRAQGAGRDLESALDQVVERLERRLSGYRERQKARRHAGTHGLESPH